MTTKHTPVHILRSQAHAIATQIQKAERGEINDPKIFAARKNPTFEVGVVMDDKVIRISIAWETVRSTTYPALVEYIVGLMQEVRNDH